MPIRPLVVPWLPLVPLVRDWIPQPLGPVLGMQSGFLWCLPPAPGRALVAWLNHLTVAGSFVRGSGRALCRAPCGHCSPLWLRTLLSVCGSGR